MKDNASFLYFLHLDPVFQFSLLIMFQSVESSLSTVFTCSFLLLRNSKWLPAIPTKFSGLAWFNDLIPCKQYPSISSCSQKRAFLSGAAGFFNEGHYCSLTFLLLSRTIPPTFWPYLLHEVFPDHSWKRIIFTFLNRYACLFWPVLHLPHSLLSSLLNSGYLHWPQKLKGWLPSKLYILANRGREATGHLWYQPGWPKTLTLQLSGCLKFVFEVPVKTPEGDRYYT